jgi:hypothetical protein
MFCAVKLNRRSSTYCFNKNIFCAAVKNLAHFLWLIFLFRIGIQGEFLFPIGPLYVQESLLGEPMTMS